MRAPPQKEIKESGIKEKRRLGRKRRISIGVEKIHRIKAEPNFPAA
jgi:hypothetical protein